MKNIDENIISNINNENLYCASDGFMKYDNPYDSQRFSIIKSLIPERFEKRMLDIGAGPGYFAKYLYDNNWTTTIIDASPKNIMHASEYSTFSYLGDAIEILNRLSLERKVYDLILALEIIEHIPKEFGNDFLRTIYSLLSQKGTLIISTPNKYSLESFGGYYLNERLFRKEIWTAWDITHKYIYNSFEIKKLLLKSGYKIERTIGYYYDGEIPYLGEIKVPLKMSSLFPINMVGFNTIMKCSRNIK